MAETKHYYSRSKGLHICMDPGRMESVDGSMTRVGEVHVQFAEIGDFGYYQTDDTSIQAALDKREREVGDVFGPKLYQKLSVPAELRADNLERELADKNRLIAQLTAERGGTKNANSR